MDSNDTETLSHEIQELRRQTRLNKIGLIVNGLFSFLALTASVLVPIYLVNHTERETLRISAVSVPTGYKTKITKSENLPTAITAYWQVQLTNTSLQPIAIESYSVLENSNRNRRISAEARDLHFAKVSLPLTIPPSETKTLNIPVHIVLHPKAVQALSENSLFSGTFSIEEAVNFLAGKELDFYGNKPLPFPAPKDATSVYFNSIEQLKITFRSAKGSIFDVSTKWMEAPAWCSGYFQ